MATTGRSSAALLVLMLMLGRAEATADVARGVSESRRLVQRASGSAERPNEPRSNEYCKCGVSESPENELVLCDQNQLLIRECYCLTYTYENNASVINIGPCFVGCLVQPSIPFYYNVSNLEQVCRRLHRDGLFCGRCEETFVPPVYSYNMTCVQCNSSSFAANCLQYLAVSLLPLTVFFVVVLVFGIRATSPQLNAFVLVSQILTSPPQPRLIATSNVQSPLLWRLLVMLYGIWNLDFFRGLYPPFCIHPDMTVLGVLALDYLVAVYPLVLIAVTYVLVILYDRYNCGILRGIIGRLCRCKISSASLASRIHKWDIRNSLIGAFATFLLLSYVKFLSVSADLLYPVDLYTCTVNMNCTKSSQRLYYYDASIEFFGPQHRPYAIAAVLVIVVFNVLPVALLCLYPCRCFQRLLPCTRLRCLHTFMDAFQGAYRNGTEGTLDCRYFAAVYLVLRIAIFVTYSLTSNVYYYSVVEALLIGVVMLIAILRPYKQPVYNTLDITLILVVDLMYFLVVLSYIMKRRESELYGTLAVPNGILMMVPLVYIVAYVLFLLCTRNKLLFRKLIAGRPVFNVSTSIPHRLWSNEYEVLTGVSESETCRDPSTNCTY